MNTAAWQLAQDLGQEIARLRTQRDTYRKQVRKERRRAELWRARALKKSVR